MRWHLQRYETKTRDNERTCTLLSRLGGLCGIHVIEWRSVVRGLFSRLLTNLAVLIFDCVWGLSTHARSCEASVIETRAARYRLSTSAPSHQSAIGCKSRPRPCKGVLFGKLLFSRSRVMTLVFLIDECVNCCALLEMRFENQLSRTRWRCIDFDSRFVPILQL